MPEEMTIGEILQNARLAKGYNYDQVEKSTNIRHIYLAALEANEFEKLPGEVFIKGMLRTYGNHLGLDGNELVNQYKALKTGLSKKDVTSKGIREVDNVKMSVRLKEKRDIGAGRGRKINMKVAKEEIKIPWREITAGVVVIVLIAIGYAAIPKLLAYMNRPKPATQVEVKQEAAPAPEVKKDTKVEDSRVEAKEEAYVPVTKASQAPLAPTVAPTAKAAVNQPTQAPAVVSESAPKDATSVAPVVKAANTTPKTEAKAPVVKQEAPKAASKAVTPKVENKPIKAK